MQKISKIIGRAIKLIKNLTVKSREKKLLVCLKKLPIEGLTLIDIGAAGDIEERWKNVSPFINYFGFEPDDRSRTKLIENNSCLSYQMLPFAAWSSSGTVKINLCKKPEVSSIYEPNYLFTNLFPNAKRFNVETTEEMICMRLDDHPFEASDFIKLDIQGGESEVIKGATETLKKTLGLSVEVIFLPLYNNQPLFGDLCKLLDESGFEFIDFLNGITRWERKAYTSIGQCIFSDALFMRTPEYLLKEPTADESLVAKYLGICLIYNRFDLIDKVFELIENKLKEKFKPFMKSIKPMRKTNEFLVTLNRYFTSFLGFFGVEYKSHLLY